VTMTIAVSSRWSAIGGVVGRSPRFSAFTIEFSCYGLWGHCGHGERWFSCPGVPPFDCCAVREGGHYHTRQSPPIRTRIGLVSQFRDHIPNNSDSDADGIPGPHSHKSSSWPEITRFGSSGEDGSGSPLDG
jgi:hypothetical protein